MVVIRNRRANFKRWRAIDQQYRSICLAPMQFSCWNFASGTNHDRLMQEAEGVLTTPAEADPLIKECLFLADGVMFGTLQDRTGGADSYFAPAAMVPPGRVPSWAAGRPLLLIGDQQFCRVVL